MYRKAQMMELIYNDNFLYSNKEFPTQDFQLFQEMGLIGRFSFIDDTTIIRLHDSISVPKDIYKQYAFRLGFYKKGLYIIDKYKLPLRTQKIWFRRQLYYFLNFNLQYTKQLSTIRWIVFQATERGYQLPLFQILKYFLIRLLIITKKALNIPEYFIKCLK